MKSINGDQGTSDGRFNGLPGEDNLSANQEEIIRLIAEKRERQKELGALNQTNMILREDRPIGEMLSQIVMLLPPAWQYPEDCVARLKYGGDVFLCSKRFQETRWYQRKSFETIDGKEGTIEVFYLKEHKQADEGPFLMEERQLIGFLANLISGHLNTRIGKNLLKKTSREEGTKSDPVKEVRSLEKGRHLLHNFLKKHNSDRDIYHDLMQYKVREILLVANLYDAYNIEQEGRFFERVSGEYYQLNLSSAPRITGVSTPDEALERLQEKYYDLVIVMMGVDKTTPVQLTRIIKQIYPKTPIFLLLNNNSDVAAFEDGHKPISTIDRVFVWNGDSNVFLAMVKYIEDRFNVENDVRIGMVRVILLVEDSARYYSRYLPVLYSIVIQQVQQLIEEVNTDELYKLLKMRVRPKVLLASNFSEAKRIINQYKDNLLCIISDVKFEKDGILDEQAGVSLINYAKELIPDLPTVLQSSDETNSIYAHELQSTFIHKNSENLIQDIQSFINYYLGFGSFKYKDAEGRRDIATARSMKEFQKHLYSIPEQSLIYHARKNHFSNWLMARGEIQIARLVKPLRVEDFPTPGSLRKFLIDTIDQCLHDKQKGKVINFDETAIVDDTNIVSLAAGSLGGKGRGLAYINMIVNNFIFDRLIPDITVRVPLTTIIGTEEFEYFVQKNDILTKIAQAKDYEEIKKIFVNGNLSDTLRKRLAYLVSVVKKPVAIRSSSLFEDSLMQPFAGIFSTFLLPNNHSDEKENLEKILTAIKLVFASIYSPTALAYFKAVNYKVEEEKMAIVIQEVVGNRHEDYFYPHISGVAQSYNYYPYSYMKPEEGFAVMAVGLGKYVVEGEKTFRFSCVHPKLEILTPKDQYRNSQLHFYAINMAKQDFNLLDGEDAALITLDIDKAEEHGNLKHCASVYDQSSDFLSPGIDKSGPRVINFANILKYDYTPLAGTLELILDLISESMGTPVEIEFAVDLKKNNNGTTSFYLLQVKPLVKNVHDCEISIDKIEGDRLLLYSENGMGNGRVNTIFDLIYVDVDVFSNMVTEEIRDEIEKLNVMLVAENRKYVLIGPGRWGTRDRFIGIPVTWSQISNARIIVEVGLEGFALDASLGSHFFHNVISMNVGYFSVKHNDQNEFVNFKSLNALPAFNRTKYLRHIRFDSPLEIVMDGKKRVSLIYFPENH